MDKKIAYKGSNNPNWRGGKITLFCKVCKKPYKRHFSQVKTSHYCSFKCLHKPGENNPTWKGGRKYSGWGYVEILKPEHPYCKTGGYVLEHKLVMEKHLGRFLKKEEIVHHINGIKDDNRIENLKITNQSKHSRYHNLKNHENIIL